MKKIALLLLVHFAVFAGQGEIIELDKETYQNMVKNSSYLIVDVYANWCGPCKLLAPVLQTLNSEYGHLYQFAKLEASEKNQDLIQSLDVKGLPTVIFYENGKEVGRTVGFLSAEKVREAIKEHFPSKS